ncbi:MAG: DNA-3-methyladenine glycosylase I [Flavobacteriaceae bacterium]|nr:DNA-3-methyladenine glycosylase I [Flavobacteriaceae bacterium]
MQNQYKCSWCKGSDLYEKYHDTEWGVPVFDDQALFEFLTLETFQAGLSWITVLRKRPEFRKAFDQFNYHKILHYNSQKEKELMNNSSIIRNRLKISATIQNANAFIEIQSKKGSFSNYLWEFVNGSPKINLFKNSADIPSFSPLAVTLSKDLKLKGFKFVGPTVIYAFMQATGMVNDHVVDCFRYKEVLLKR